MYKNDFRSETLIRQQAEHKQKNLSEDDYTQRGYVIKDKLSLSSCDA